MPIEKSAFKDLRQNKKRALRNKKTKDKIKSLEKKFFKAVEAKDKDKAQNIFLQLQKTLDKAAKKDVIKKNKTSRKKSMLSKVLRQINSIK